MYQRRDFLKTAATGIALTAVSGKILGCSSSSLFHTENIKEFGIQLYTLRDVMPKDPKGVLKQVAEMGYKQIESFEGAKGMFWGMTNIEFKQYMDDLGMKLVSSHCGIEKDFERKAGEAAEIGMKYLLAGSVGPKKNIEESNKIADNFNQLGQVCKSAGLRFGYHNHDYPFKPVDGQVPMDVMIRNTDPALVDFEMDIYWVVTVGEDPVKWFEKYPNRFRLCHIKDRKKNVPLSEKNASCILGQGQIDFATILKAGQKKGLQYFIVEQERYDNSTSLRASKENAEYMKKIRI